MCCFFLQNLQRFCYRYPTLFGKGDAEEREDEGGSSNFSDGFNENFGWIYNTTRVAELKRIPLSEAEDLKLVEFFNYLVYIKEKDKHDALNLKNARNTKH